MLNELLKLNKAVTALVNAGLSPVIVTMLPVEHVPDMVKQFGSCDKLRMSDVAIQSYFLAHKDIFDLCDELSMPHYTCSLISDCAIVPSKDVLRSLADIRRDSTVLSLLSVTTIHVTSVQSILRNIKSRGAKGPLSYLNIWQYVRWRDSDLAMVEDSPLHQHIAQFINEHIESSVDSSVISSILYPEETYRRLFHTWFSCGKNKREFTRIVCEYAEYRMLDLIADSTPMEQFAARFPEYLEFMDYIDFRGLNEDVRELIVFALFHSKTAFLRFIQRNVKYADSFAGSIVTQQWFRIYLDIDEMNADYAEKLLELPSANIYGVSDAVSVSAFLEQVY